MAKATSAIFDVKQPVIYEEADNYAPNRFEHFAGLAMQGLCAGRSERDLGSVVRKAIALATEMEAHLDSAKS